LSDFLRVIGEFLSKEKAIYYTATIVVILFSTFKQYRRSEKKNKDKLKTIFETLQEIKDSYEKLYQVMDNQRKMTRQSHKRLSVLEYKIKNIERRIINK
jgi:hypothetical protein